MGFFKVLFWGCSIALWIAICVFTFLVDSFLGIGGILTVLAFLIAWAVADEVTISSAHEFFLPDWSVYKKKLKYAHGVAATVYVIAFIVLIFISA